MIYCDKQKKIVKEEGFCLLCDCKQVKTEEIDLLKAKNLELQKPINEQIALAIEDIAKGLVGRLGDLLRSKAQEWRHKC